MPSPSFLSLSRTDLLPLEIASSCLASSNIFPSPIASATSSFIFALIRFIAANPGQTTPLVQRPVLHYCRTDALVPALPNNELEATDPLLAGRTPTQAATLPHRLILGAASRSVSSLSQCSHPVARSRRHNLIAICLIFEAGCSPIWPCAT